MFIPIELQVSQSFSSLPSSVSYYPSYYLSY